MIFSNKNATSNVMHAAKLDNVLSQVTKAITRSHVVVETKAADSESRMGYKTPKNRISERELHLMALLQQDYHADPLPTSNNYWLAQEDPHFAKQAQKEAAIPRMSRKAGSGGGVLMSRADITRAYQEQLQRGAGASGHPAGEGAFSHFPNIHLMGSNLSLKQGNQRRIDKATKEAWPRDVM